MRDPQQGVDVVVAAVGFVSLGLLWLGLVLGLVLRDGRALDRMRPATLAANHQTMIACGMVLATVHALGQLAVAGSDTTLISVMIPFLHTSHPIGVGLGVLGLELTIALAASMALRKRLGYHRWRVLHRLTYVAFALIVAHVVGIGVRSWWLRLPILVVATLTVGYGLATAGWFRDLLRRLAAPPVVGRRRRLVTTIDVDAARCVHFGFCQHEAPELFELREDGRLRHEAAATAAQTDAATRAARACPTRAIRLGGDAVRVTVTESEVVDAEPDPPTADPPSADQSSPSDSDQMGEAVDGDRADVDPAGGVVIDGQVVDAPGGGARANGDPVGGARVNGARRDGGRAGHAFTA